MISCMKSLAGSPFPYTKDPLSHLSRAIRSISLFIYAHDHACDHDRGWK
jgi:hypothetical protein